MPKINLNVAELTTEKAELGDFLATPNAYNDPQFSAKNKRFTELEAMIEKATLRDVLERQLKEAKETLEKAKHKDEKSDRLIELEHSLRATRDEKEAVWSQFGRIDGELSSLIKMVKKQEEVAYSLEHKTVPLSEVERLYSQVEEKVKNTKSMAVLESALQTLDEIASILSNFIDSNKDKVDNSLIADSKKRLKT